MATARSNYYKKLTGDVKARYDEKISKCNGTDPYAIKEKDLSSNPKDLPDITLLDIGNYLVHSVSTYTKKSFKAYKSMEAYKYFESGFVLNMGSKNYKNSAIVRGKVKHSQRMNKAPVKVWILANMDGEIICGHCTCLAGLSESCSHVGAICFAIFSIAESIAGSAETKSVTELLCKWNVPTFKEASMSTVKNINWTSRSLERVQNTPIHVPESNFVSYCNSLTSFSDDIIDQFIRDSHSAGDDTALGTILFSSEIRRRTNIKDDVFLTSLYNEVNLNKSRAELVEIGKAISLDISNEDVREISRITELNSKFCLALKRGRITGSSFKHSCATTIDNPSITTINRVINPMKNYGFTPTVRYQIKNKKKAIEQYFRSHVLEHDNFAYSKCGLVINPELPYFACTPDGIVSCNCHGNGCIKVKCLKMLERGGSLEILISKPNHILNKEENEYFLDKNHEFFYQVQLQLHLIKLNYCDLIIWSPTYMKVLRVDADINFCKMTIERARSFHEQAIMPELLGKFYTKTSDSPAYVDESQEDKYELVQLEIELLG